MIAKYPDLRLDERDEIFRIGRLPKGRGAISSRVSLCERPDRFGAVNESFSKSDQKNVTSVGAAGRREQGI